MTELPPLPLADWRATKDTLHLWCQVVGKVRLASTAPRNHWWNVPLYVDVRGLTTRRMRRAGTTFAIELDLVDDRARVRTADGREASFTLEDGLSVAAFDRLLHERLAQLGIDLELLEQPFGVPTTTPFPQDEHHASYDGDAVRRFWHALDWSDRVFEEFSGWWSGKTSPVHLFWHSFDLAVTRFSGRRAPALPGADPVTREAYSHELISFGFWAGDDRTPYPAYYSYAAPEPQGLRTAPLAAGAQWVEMPNGSMAILPYEAVREAADPRLALLAFLQSAYEAGARAARWDDRELASSWAPSPEELAALSRR